MNGSLLRTPLYEEHVSSGAKMVEFSGWEMPVQYADGIITEHLHTRNSVSLFDICHMGEFRVKGAAAGEALDKILARAVADQKNGTCRYNFLLTDRGTVMDDLIVYRLADDEFYIVVNASTIDSDAKRISSLLPSGVRFTDESAKTAKLDLQGPESANVLETLGLAKNTLPAYYSWGITSIKGIPCTLSRTGYTGELGFEIYIAEKYAVELWRLLCRTGNVKPAGLGARDTIRLEMGYPLYGHELDLETTPVEAGFGKMLKLDSGRTFPGSENLRNSQISKKLVGIELEGRRAARAGTRILFEGKDCGIVTSGAFSPSLSLAVAMGYVGAEIPDTPGTRLELSSERFSLGGVVSPPPFYKKGTAKINLL